MDLGSVPTFLSREAGKHVPELSNPSAELLQKAEELYTAYRGRLPSPPPPEPLRPSKQLEIFKQEFSVGISDFLNRSQDAEATQAFTNSSWDGLRAEASKAEAAYNKHQTRRRNWRRPFEVLDHAGEKAMTNCCVEFLLELVPDGEYSSLLSGGLTLAYNTALRKERLRENILELFDSLSERSEQTKSKIRLYSHDPDLHAKSEQLYMAVMDCVRLSIEWLDSSSAFESFKAFFQQSRYKGQTRLEEAKANLDTRAKEFEDTVNMCFKRQVNEIHTNLEWLKMPILATFSLLAEFTKDFPAKAQLTQLTQLLQQAQQLRQQQENLARTSMITMQPTQVNHNLMYRSQLCRYLAVEHASVTLGGQEFVTAALSELNGDITAAMQHIPSALQREKTGFLALSSQFATWLRCTDSAFLVAHEGECPHHSALSTLSHLCGLMARTMRTPGIWTLAFFCGLHTAAGALLQGGRGLMRAITLQLLSTIPQETFKIPLDPYTIGQQLEGGCLEMICSVFTMGLGRLSAGMVFVLIDGAHWNGTEARSADMRALVRFLSKTVDQLRVARRGLVLKVLVTNPSARQRYEWDLPGLDIYMEREVLAGGHQGVAQQVISRTVQER